MAKDTSTDFDGASVKFAEYAETVRGYVRYHVTQRNLEHIISNKQLKVADIGGGAAIDAAWLASYEHEVVLVEPSEEQLLKGGERLSELPKDVQVKVEFVKGDVEKLLNNGQAGTFDLVLSHGVAMYLPDPTMFIANLGKLLKPGGYLSLLEKGYEGAEIRLMNKGQLEELDALRNGENQANNVARTRKAFRPEDLEAMLSDAHLEVVEWSGVRIATETDERPISMISEKELKSIVTAEYERGKNKALRSQGQMLHFIAQKPQSGV